MQYTNGGPEQSASGETGLASGNIPKTLEKIAENRRCSATKKESCFFFEMTTTAAATKEGEEGAIIEAT